jgi:hypothetical protein
MNRCFLSNAVLLLLSTGIQQWLLGLCSKGSFVLVRFSGFELTEDGIYWEIVTRLPFIVAAISLALTIGVLRNQQVVIKGRFQRAVAYVLSPLFCFFVVNSGQSLPHSWTVAELAGPQVIFIDK